MKILYHHRVGSKDGQYVHIEEMIAALRALGHEVVIIGPALVEKEEFGAEAAVVSRLKRALPAAVYELMELAYSFLGFARLNKAVLKHQPDCLYERYNLFMPAGVWIKRKFGLPMLLEVNAPLYHERKHSGGIALNALARWTERYVWRGADYVLPVTRELAKFIEDAGVPEEQVVVIPNGVDQKRFANAPSMEEAKRRLGLEGHLVLGFTGFMRDWHGLDRVVELIADITREMPCHLLLVGDGPARAALEKKAAGLRVADKLTITGIVSRDVVANYIAAFDIALQPAVTPYASPLKIFEYMALGRAIVAPAQRNIMELLTDGDNAVLFDPDNPIELGNSIRRLCADPKLRQQLGQRARNALGARELTWHHNAERVVELFSRCASSRFGVRTAQDS